MSYKNVGLGIGMDDSAGARGEIIAGGRLLLSIGSVDMGQGSDTTMAQIASETLGWPYSRIVVQSADTERDPLAGMTTASRQTFVSGNAVLNMAEKLKEKMFTYLADEFGLDPNDIGIKGTAFYQKATGKPLLSLEAFSEHLQMNGVTLSAEYRYTAPRTYLSLKEPPGGYPAGEDRLHVAYCFAAQAVILEVHEKTGKVNVLKVIAASDTGRPVNPHAVEGQIEGGVVMGLGYALSEECKVENGKVVSDTYAKLGVRRIGQTPDIKSIIIENPHAEGPYGAKGMGELPLSAGAPAVVHAIYDALGIWITSLPITPQKILECLQ
jgi:CO/xanthine dehydrogenase Mo-binding subunit